MISLTDQLGRELSFETTPKRIISLVPSLTEFVVDLGLRDNLVGCTKFCVHPRDLTSQITVVGGTKQVHYDRIKALHPEIILANKEENTPEMVAELEKIAPVYVSDIITFEDAYACFEDYGKIFQVTPTTQQFINSIHSGFEDIPKVTAPLKVIYLIWQNPYMAVGGDAYINSVLSKLGFENYTTILHADSRYPEVTVQDLHEADIIFLSTEPFPFKNTHASALQKETGKRVILVDGEFFSWYGSRMVKAIPYFKKLLAQIQEL